MLPQRNPSIKLYGLPWGFPGWVGEGSGNLYHNVLKTADYIVRWVNGAKKTHNLTIDYIGVSCAFEESFDKKIFLVPKYLI